MRPPVNSIKNEVTEVQAVVASTNLVIIISNAVSNPEIANNADVQNGSTIKAIWLEMWYYGLSAGNTNDIIDFYVMKNPGNNLTPPNPGTVGTSNEKKFVFKSWKGLAGNKSLGGQAYTWRGWIKIPKIYQRQGTADRFIIVARSPTTGNFCKTNIYKWYS